MKLNQHAVRIPALLLEDGTVAAIGPLSKAAMTRAKLSAKSQGREAREVEVEIKRIDLQVNPHPSTLKHEWIVSGKDGYGEFKLKYNTREGARDCKRGLNLDVLHLEVKRVDPITHRVYQLVKEEKVS